MMSELIRVDQRGIFAESEETQESLARRRGRYCLLPTSPDLFLGIRTPYAGENSSTPRVVLAGDLSGMPLSDIVAFLNQNRTSGALRVICSGVERVIVFKSGQVHTASSDSPAESITQIALRLGLVTQAQLEQVLTKNPPPSRIGRFLVEAGALQSHDLWRCMQQQASEIFHSILLAQDGLFLLLNQPVEDTGGLALDTQALLMDAIRRIDEMREFRKRLHSSRAYVTRVRNPEGALDTTEQQVFERCNGDQTVAQIGQALKMTEFDVTKAIHHLIGKGLVAAQPSPQSNSNAPRPPSPDEIVRVFSFIFREIFAEVEKVNMAAELIAAGNVAISQQSVRRPVLRGIQLRSDGTLSDGVFANLAKLSEPPVKEVRTLHAALSELMYFLLFEAHELLEPKADEDLARRVKELLATIEGAS